MTKISEALRRGENQKMINNLRGRVQDWKGHLLQNFGKLVLYDLALVTRSDLDRPYSVFLFEKIVILCKEVIPNTNKNQKSSTKRYNTPSDEDTAIMVQKKTPLLLKGRIYIANIVSVSYTQSQFYLFLILQTYNSSLFLPFFIPGHYSARHSVLSSDHSLEGRYRSRLIHYAMSTRATKNAMGSRFQASHEHVCCSSHCKARLTTEYATTSAT